MSHKSVSLLSTIVCCLSAVANAAFAQDLTFTATTYDRGLHETSDLTMADVNGDGKLDMICVNTHSNSLSVLTNNGSGVFSLNATPSVGLGPMVVLAADVNGDNKLDLISLSANANTLTVLTNNGQGVFGFNATVTLPSGPTPTWLAAADINGDNHVDLIVDNIFPNQLVVLTNNGSGAFGHNTTLPSGSFSLCVQAVDINADNKPDLIAAGQGGTTLLVYTNNGSGVFGSNATVFAGAGPFFVATADLNGDGKIDLVCSDPVYGGPPSVLMVLTNNGSGVFGSNATLHAGIGSEAIAVADLNGDGLPDLVCINDGNCADLPGCSSTLTVLTNRGGAFGYNTTIDIGVFGTWVEAADVNGDGKPDLICVNAGRGYGPNTVNVLINTTPFPRPPLKIVKAGNRTIVSWPSWSGSYTLQTNANLGASNWVNYGGTVFDNGTIKTVTNTTSTGRLFFRLKQ